MYRWTRRGGISLGETDCQLKQHGNTGMNGLRDGGGGKREGGGRGGVADGLADRQREPRHDSYCPDGRRECEREGNGKETRRNQIHVNGFHFSFKILGFSFQEMQ